MPIPRAACSHRPPSSTRGCQDRPPPIVPVPPLLRTELVAVTELLPVPETALDEDGALT